MARRSKGVRYQLGEPLQGNLADFCAAHYHTPEINVIRAALERFIDERLAEEPKMRERFEDERRKRLQGEREPFRVIDADEKD